MNTISSLKQVQVRDMLDSAWPEILERQAALETPVWIEEWLGAAHVQMQQELPASPVETWLEIAARQQLLDTPVWQTEWLNWADNRPVSSSAADSGPTHTVCSFYSAKHPVIVVKDRSDTKRHNAQRTDEYREIAA